MENEVKVDEVELTPEEKARRVEEFFAKKQRQGRGEEEAPTAATVRHADGTEERIEMGSVAGAGAMGAVEGAATGALKGAGRAVKAGVGGLIVDPLIGATKLAGTPVRMLGWDGIHRLADAAEKGWNEWGSEALDFGYEDWGTKLGDAGAKITGIAGMLGGMMGPGALAKAPGLIGKAAKAYNAALPFIFGNSAAVDTYDRAMASGQSEGRALAEAATDGAINFLGFKLFANKSLNRMLKIPEMQGPMAERLTKEGIGKGIKGFESLVKAVRNGSVSEILVNRAKGAVKAGGIMGVQDFLSSVVKQYADESVKPVEEMSDEELAAAKGQIDAWEAEQAKAAAEGRDPDVELKPEWEKDVWDRLAVGLKAGLRGAGEGALMEGVMGGGELALSMKEAREQTAAAIRRLIATPKGRAFLAKQDPNALGIVEGVAREGGTVTAEQLDAAGLPPDMPMREVRRLAFELKRDGEMAEKRAEMETEAYRKRAELAERLAHELEEGKELEFDTEEQKAEAELALEERKERIDEARADEMVARGQGMADTLFGEEAGVLVRRGTAEERRAAAEGAVGKGADARTLKDAEGQVCGYWDRGRNEVVLFGNADAKTVAHELGWHATWQWAEKHSPELLAKMKAYAQSCPPELRAEIKKMYPDFAKNPDALLDEIGAGRFEKEMGAKFGEMLERSPEAKGWWQGLKETIAEAWRGMVRGLGDWKIGGLEDSRIDLKALEAMTPEKGMEWLADRMIEGKTLKGGEAAKNAKGAEGQSGEVRYARKLIGGKETAVVEGYPLSLREARDPDKVLGALAPLVGKSAAQIGESKLTRITEKSVEHLMNSDHARSESKASGKAAKKLWRGTVAGMSVTDDIIATSQLGAKEMPKHLNAEWKKGATFYRADTRFAVEVENGRYEIYPCKIIVSELNGERIVYDITEIGTPTPTTSVSTKTSTVGGPQGGLTANGGVGVSMGADYSTGGEAAQGGGAKQAKERKVTPEEDAAYEEAVKRGDMETVRRMEREVYERMGYSDDSGYQGTSAFNGPAPSRNAYFETKAERIEATKNGEMEDTTTLGDFRDGIDVNNLQFIVFDPRSERNADTKRQEAIRNIRGVLEDGKDTITMYRSVPADVKEGQFRNGDWITPSRAYAEENARIHGWEKSRIIEQEVSVEDVWWDGNDIAEWGFDDGKGSVYKNTLANRKLLGPTYDDAGNLIPLSKRFNDWKQDIRYQRRSAEEPPAQELRRAEEEIERTERALKAVREGRVRVAAAGGEAGEASDPGAAAGAELLAAQRVAPSDDRSLANPVALPMSGLVGLYRALRSNPALPKVLIEAKRKGAAWVSRLTKGSDVELNPEAFGIIDETDRARIKEEMKSEGMFRDEDPVWNMKHSKKECEAERQLSEMRLEDRLGTLADRRSKGLEPGGGRVATNALAHEIGRLVMEMPMSEKLRSAAGKEGAATLKDLRTVGEGIVKELRKQLEEAGGDVEDPKLIGSALKQAVDAAAWWRGDVKGVEEYERIAREKGEEGLKAAEAEEARAKTALAKDAKGLAGELFGMFLAAPETLRERAPAAFRRIVDAMGANETLAAAYARIASADAPTEVMAKIREQWTHEAQVELRALEREIDAPLGTLWQRVKRRAILNLHSKEGAAVSIIDDALQERVAAAKRAVKVAKKSGGKAEIARAEANLEAVRKEAKDQLIDLKMGVLKKQRGGGMEREYALNVANRVMGDIARDGVELEDLRTYIKAKWCIALQGRADSFGMSPQEANQVIEGMRSRLGEADFAKLESAQRRFGEERRRAILENPDVVAAFGPALVEAWKRNADYVRSERILSAQQVKEYKAAREEWLRKNPGQVDVLGDIELMVEMHRVRHGGSDGSVFAKPLEGSFKATGDPLAYTMMHDMHILQFARRNALVTQIADMASELKMEGFKEVSDANLGRALEGSKRYGSVAFMRNGERKLLIMPKVAAEGFKSMGEGDVAGLVKANRMVSAILTQYSPRFAWRNMFRNRQAVENNIPWMRESKLQTVSRYFGLGPVAKLAEHLMERAVVRLPDSVVRNRAMSLVWGENTTMYWIGEATRIAKLMFDPKAIRSLAERADAAAADGDLAAAQAIMEEIAKARDMTGQADRADLDAVFAALDMRTNFTGERFEGLRRAARAAKDLADTVRRFNTFEEARIKIVAELAAARARNNAAADGREFRYSQKEVDYLTATMAGSPRYEMRGRWMNVLEAIPFGPFANVGMKGAWRTVESMKTDPKAWWGKASHRIAGRMAEIALWGAGGYALVAAIARRMFGDDEEAQKAIDGFESFGKRMARARACISDYRLRNYDIVPLGLYGKWCSFGINMPRGDEDRMIMPLTDTVSRYLLKSDAAKRAGLHDPIDGAYTPVEAGVATLMDSGLAPDIYRGSMIWNLGKDTLYAWLQNPYNTFTKRNTYGQAVWENRFGSWSQAKDFFVETMKQAWNDVGGQVVVPATTWDEDAGGVPDEGKWVMGMADPKDAAEMPVGGRTIFRALHYVPMASSMLSGMFYMNCDGDARIARRLEKLQAGEKAARDIVAMKCLRMQLKDMDVAVDYSKVLDEAIGENGWDEMDRALIEQALVRKLKAAAKKMGRENVPILDVFNKTVSERERVGMERYLTGIGWEME